MKHMLQLIALLAGVLLFAGPGAAAPPTIETVDDLLAEIEKAGDGLESLTARIQYTRRFQLQGDVHIRRGRLAYAADPSNRRDRRFAVYFDTLLIPSARMEEDPQHWIFDGEWLVEKRPSEKQFIKRRVAPPDASFDPLRVGEGPLPIPIGQRAEDITRRFDPELRASGELFDAESPLAAQVQGSHHLRLTPKEQYAEGEEFSEIRLWYRWDESSQRLLPILSRTTNRQGDESYVQLVDVTPAGEIDPEMFDTTSPAKGSGWDVQVIENLDAPRVQANDE